MRKDLPFLRQTIAVVIGAAIAKARRIAGLEQADVGEPPQIDLDALGRRGRSNAGYVWPLAVGANFLDLLRTKARRNFSHRCTRMHADSPCCCNECAQPRRRKTRRPIMSPGPSVRISAHPGPTMFSALLLRLQPLQQSLRQEHKSPSWWTRNQKGNTSPSAARQIRTSRRFTFIRLVPHRRIQRIRSLWDQAIATGRPSCDVSRSQENSTREASGVRR